MTDPATTTVVVHGLVAILLAVGGGVCLYFGFQLLFRRKLVESKSTFEATLGQHRIAFTAGAAGTTIVFVSTFWVAGSIVALPSFSHTADGTSVAAAIPFPGSGADLTTAQKQLIDAIGPTLTASGAPLVIEGYADTGNEATDQAVAQRRADQVRDYLVREYDLLENNIAVMAHGETQPNAHPGANSVVIRSGPVDG